MYASWSSPQLFVFSLYPNKSEILNQAITIDVSFYKNDYKVSSKLIDVQFLLTFVDITILYQPRAKHQTQVRLFLPNNSFRLLSSPSYSHNCRPAKLDLYFNNL